MRTITGKGNLFKDGELITTVSYILEYTEGFNQTLAKGTISFSAKDTFKPKMNQLRGNVEIEIKGIGMRTFVLIEGIKPNISTVKVSLGSPKWIDH